MTQEEECPEGDFCKWGKEDYDEKTVVLIQSCVRRWRAKRSFGRLVLLALHHPSMKEYKKRNDVWRELLATERQYLFSIQYCYERFYKGLIAGKVMKKKHLQVIFNGFPEILQLHLSLMKDLEQAAREWPSWNSIGKAMKQVAPWFKIYLPYPQQLKKACSLLKKHYEKDEKWIQFENKIRLESGGLGLDLKSYLIMPIQRLPRYLLLLKELLKLTPESHVDYSNIKTALESIATTLDQINSHEKEMDLQNEIDAILQKSAEEKSDLMKKMRTWGRRGMGGGKKRAPAMSLFNIPRQPQVSGPVIVSDGKVMTLTGESVERE